MATTPLSAYLTDQQMQAFEFLRDHYGREAYSASAVVAEVIMKEVQSIIRERKKQLTQLDEIHANQAHLLAVTSINAARLAAIEANLIDVLRVRHRVR